MWWFLVLLGVLIALAGLAVIGLGVSIFVSSIGNTLITTGAVAASGGFVITAMGLVLRQLERLSDRIEAALSGIEVGGRSPAVEPAAPAPVSVPAPAPRARSGAAPRLTAEDLLDTAAEDAPEEPEFSPPPRPRPVQPPRPGRAEERPASDERGADERAPDPMVEARRQRLERRAEPEARTEARAEPRAEPRPEPRADARLGPRSRYESNITKGSPAVRTPPAPPPPAGARRAESPEEPRILKSGIVGGMAYTLYSDGSIQAELPDGVVRFASLQELRDHVAQAQQNR